MTSECTLVPVATFAENFAAAVQVDGRPLRVIGAELGVSQGQVSKWAKGYDIPGDDKVEVLADFMEVSRLAVKLELHAARVARRRARSDEPLIPPTGRAPRPQSAESVRLDVDIDEWYERLLEKVRSMSWSSKLELEAYADELLYEEGQAYVDAYGVPGDPDAEER